MEKQKIKRSNDGNLELRTFWAGILSKVSGLSYKRKTQDSLLENDVELKARWSNYLKTIDYVKNDVSVWKTLLKFDATFSFATKENIRIVCDSFTKLSDKRISQLIGALVIKMREYVIWKMACSIFSEE
jgi:hypothetical protein